MIENPNIHDTPAQVFLNKYSTWWEQSSLLQLLAASSFAVIFWFAFGNSIELAFAFMLGMTVHEIAHALVFNYVGIRTKILIIFPLGAIAKPATPEENAASDRLPWYPIAWMLQAGPAANVSLMLLGVALKLTGVLQLGDALIYANGILAIFNLIPVWILDAGQLYTVVYASLNQWHDRVVSGIKVITFLLVSANIIGIGRITNGWEIAGNLALHAGVFGFLLMLIIGTLWKSSTDDPNHSNSPQAMTMPEALLHIGLHLTMCTVTLLIL